VKTSHYGKLVHSVTRCLIARIADLQETSIAKEWLGKQNPAAMDMYATIQGSCILCRGYIARNYYATNVARRDWSLEGSKSHLIVKYGHESLGTQNKESLYCQGSAAI
jgi:hypothetical protein